MTIKKMFKHFKSTKKQIEETFRWNKTVFELTRNTFVQARSRKKNDLSIKKTLVNKRSKSAVNKQRDDFKKILR